MPITVVFWTSMPLFNLRIHLWLFRYFYNLNHPFSQSSWEKKNLDKANKYWDIERWKINQGQIILNYCINIFLCFFSELLVFLPVIYIIWQMNHLQSKPQSSYCIHYLDYPVFKIYRFIILCASSKLTSKNFISIMRW